jgi:hypothetical protein
VKLWLCCAMLGLVAAILNRVEFALAQNSETQPARLTTLRQKQPIRTVLARALATLCMSHKGNLPAS